MISNNPNKNTSRRVTKQGTTEGLKFLQINLGRDRVAHDLMLATAAKLDVDVVIVGEPNINIARNRGWIMSTKQNVSLFCRTKRARVDKVIRSDNYCMVHFDKCKICCCYFSPNSTLEEFETSFGRMMRKCQDEGRNLVIAGDLNAKAPTWGSPILDRRGEKVLEWVASLDMTVQNRGDKPTFIRGGYGSHIDVTIATQEMARRLLNWAVLDEETGTNHQYIYFNINNSKNVKYTGRDYAPKGKDRDWKLFADLFSLYAKSEEEKPATYRSFSNIAKKALRGCQKEAPASQTNEPYWWKDEIGEKRSEALSARRAYTRLNKRFRGTGDLVERARELYRVKKKELKAMINAEKNRHWKNLCADLDNNIWGDAFRIVMQKIGYSRPELSVAAKLQIVEDLFPRRTVVRAERPNTDNFTPFSMVEMDAALATLKMGAAPGPDGAPAAALKAIRTVEGEWLLSLLNDLLQKQRFPNEWKKARLVLIPKEKENKYRPICLLNTVNKLLESLIKVRIEEELSTGDGLSNKQFGFRKGRSTIHAIQEVLETLSGPEKWGVLITLDVRNAFNTLPWSRVKAEMERRDLPMYLRNIVGSYLENRTLEVEKGTVVEISAGVPQGSVLGPLLWNLVYDGVLRLRWPRGVTAVGFADDLAIVAEANDQVRLVAQVENALDQVANWMRENGLTLAPEKTEAVFVKGPKIRNQTIFRIGDTVITPKKELRYLGVIIDDKLSFGKHVITVTMKSERRTGLLSRILPNIGGPRSPKRHMLSAVVHSTLLYAAPIWHGVIRFQKYRRKLIAAQRKVLLREACAYKTVSSKALQVITGTPPITLLAAERARLFARIDRTSPTSKREERERILTEWQRDWDQETQTAQWTKRLIHRIDEWIRCPHRNVNYFTTQFFTGHGAFRSFLHKIGKAQTDECSFCQQTDTAEHAIFHCTRWRQSRLEVETALGLRLDPDNVVARMTDSIESWTLITHLISDIVREKGEEGRAQQGGP